jgi:hypothetical protein
MLAGMAYTVYETEPAGPVTRYKRAVSRRRAVAVGSLIAVNVLIVGAVTDTFALATVGLVAAVALITVPWWIGDFLAYSAGLAALGGIAWLIERVVP